MTIATELRWDGYSAADLVAALNVPAVELFAEVGSTQDVAHALAQRGAHSGTLVLSETQTSGRGRQGRPWQSPPDGVWCTQIFRDVERAALDVMSLRLGLGLAERLDGLAGVTVQVKWPNDLLVDGGKMAGILIEARWSGAKLDWIAAGVGINLSAPSAVPDAVGLPAGVSRLDVLHAAVRSAHDAAESSGGLTEAELHRYGRRDWLRGRRIGAPVRGIASGIGEDGSLLVERDGTVHRCRSGTLELAEDA